MATSRRSRWQLPLAVVTLAAAATLLLPGGRAGRAQIDRDAFELQRVQNKIPQPGTLEEFAEQVRLLRELGASTAEIAEHVSKVVDARLQASNRPWDESLFNPLRRGEQADVRRRWEAIDRDRGAVAGTRPVPDGQSYVTTARLAWDNRVGNCGEAANLSYWVLKQAGIDARVFTSGAGGGHEFTVVGLSPGADANDPTTWGPDARVVDGWMGKSLTAQEAAANRFIKGMDGQASVGDQTGGIDNPAQQRAWQQMGTKGVVEVMVTSEDGAVVGATVTLSGQEPQSAATTHQGIARFVSYPGAATIAVTPPEDSGLLAGSASVYVETRQTVGVPIQLAKEKVDVEITFAVTVVDGQTNRGLAGVTVHHAGGRSTVTDGSGRAELIGIEGREATVTAVLAGYEEGAASGPIARDRPLAVRLQPLKCHDAGDRDACHKTMGGFCPCQRKGACGMPGCRFDAGQDGSAPSVLAGSGSWRGGAYTGTGTLTIDVRGGTVSGTIAGTAGDFVISGRIQGRWAGDHATGRLVDGSYSYTSQSGDMTFRGGGTVTGALVDGVVSGSWSGADDSGTFSIPVVGRGSE